MEWTSINVRYASGWQSWYNDSITFKKYYELTSLGSDTAEHTFTSDLGVISFRYATTSSSNHGIRDSITGKDYTLRNGSGGEYIALTNYAELTTSNVEIIAFKDGDPNHPYWFNDVRFDLGNGKKASLRIGYSVDSVYTAMISTDKTSSIVNLIDFINGQHAINDNFGYDYVVQPLYVLDEATPLYTIYGNTILAPFTLIQVQSRKFLVVGKGVCVEVD